ncbi:MAG: CbtA family protein [Rhizobiaceae bacterium]
MLAAIFAGVLAGVFATAVQSYRVIPLIQAAEKYEGGESSSHDDHGAAAKTEEDTGHSHQQTAASGHDHTPKPAASGHEHNAEAWAPADGLERLFYTGVSNVVIGVAFALILTAGILLTQSAVSLQAGLAWGAAGFVVFVLAPNFGLPPELPGMQAAGVAERQIWWAATAILTAAGLYLFAFKTSLIWMLLGVALLVAPHLYGAPQPLSHETAVPANLAAEFVMATIVASALFWLFLGGLLGALQSKALAKE